MKQPYLVLLRGINVGGKNPIPMATLRMRLMEAGFDDVATYIASGNVIVSSALSSKEIRDQIEAALPTWFDLDNKTLRVAVLDQSQIEAVIRERPAGFGDQPDSFHSDVVFLMDIGARDALKAFRPREGVDAVWSGPGVIYSQRLSAERTKSRLGAIIGSPEYAAMTIRNWRTVTKLAAMMAHDNNSER